MSALTPPGSFSTCAFRTRRAAFAFENGGAMRVERHLLIDCVRRAVNLDDKLRLHTGEIHDERADPVLPAELRSAHSAIAKQLP